MGRNPIISREAAAQKALEIIDVDGLDGLNLERIAKALGVRAPSLYHHFKDKAEILAEVARLVFAEVDIERHDADWAQYMINISLSFNATVLRHPNAAALLIEAMPDRVAAPTFALGARAMEEAGIDPSLHLIIMEGMEKITWGATIRQAMLMRRGGREASAAALESHFPELARAYRTSRWADEEILEASLRAFLRGVLADAEETPEARRVTRRARAQQAERATPRRAVANRS
jgi:TetR/AcrR family transcriptional regulator, tetracycline repressor protein